MNWSQLRTILWLRWRLTKNQWSRGGGLNATLTLIAALLGVSIGLAGCIGGILAGSLALANAPPQVLLLVWDAIIGTFLFFWMIGIVTEIQRAEAIDLSRLLHLPVSLKGVFVVNYLASHFTLSIIVFLPGMLGLSAGLIWGQGVSMLLLIPLALSFVFMVTAWTYCLRGWLIALMINQRRRRAVIIGATMAVMLLSQLPNLYFNVIRNRSSAQSRNNKGAQTIPRSPPRETLGKQIALPPEFLAVHKYVPPMWVGNGAMALATGNAWPAVGGSIGAMVIGALGLLRAYRSTVRFYQGTQNPKPSRERIRTETTRKSRKNFLERRLPAVPDEVTALTLAFFRSLTRAPEVKMALATNLIMLVVFGAMFGVRGVTSTVTSESAKAFMATGAGAFTFLGLLQLMFNQFGFDREGFRALVLLPAPRKYFLLAKNLSFLPLGIGIGCLFLVTIEIFLRVPVLAALAACLQLVTTFLVLCIAGNFLSVVLPYRIAAGSLKPTKAPAKRILLTFASHLLFPVAMVPIFFPPALGLLSDSLGWWPAGLVNVILSLLLLALVLFCYRLSLDSLGHLLERKEKEILKAVTQEVE